MEKSLNHLIVFQKRGTRNEELAQLGSSSFAEVSADKMGSSSFAEASADKMGSILSAYETENLKMNPVNP